MEDVALSCRCGRVLPRCVSCCVRMRLRATMTGMVLMYRRPADAVQLSIEPRLASWDRAGHPSQVRLADFLAHVDAVARPVMALLDGRVAAELTVGLPDALPLINGGRDLDNYLFPVVQRLGRQRIAAIFGRKIRGPSSLAIGPAQPQTAATAPLFSTRMTGSYERRQWKQDLRKQPAAGAGSHGQAGAGRDGHRGDDRAGPQLGQPVEAAHRRLRPCAG
jgi:hypothetical protein